MKLYIYTPDTVTSETLKEHSRWKFTNTASQSQNKRKVLLHLLPLATNFALVLCLVGSRVPMNSQEVTIKKRGRAQKSRKEFYKKKARQYKVTCSTCGVECLVPVAPPPNQDLVCLSCLEMNKKEPQ